jgi:hypothetical protein
MWRGHLIKLMKWAAYICIFISCVAESCSSRTRGVDERTENLQKQGVSKQEAELLAVNYFLLYCTENEGSTGPTRDARDCWETEAFCGKNSSPSVIRIDKKTGSITWPGHGPKINDPKAILQNGKDR